MVLTWLDTPYSEVDENTGETVERLRVWKYFDIVDENKYKYVFTNPREPDFELEKSSGLKCLNPKHNSIVHARMCFRCNLCDIQYECQSGVSLINLIILLRKHLMEKHKENSKTGGGLMLRAFVVCMRKYTVPSRV